MSLGAMAFVPFPGNPSEKTRQEIALRYIGDQLLRQSGDNSSRILPVARSGASEYVLTFAKPLSFSSDSLVSLFERQVQNGKLPPDFSVEAIDQKTGLTTYAFELPSGEIPCLGRHNPVKQYQIRVQFSSQNDLTPIWFAGIPFALFFLVLGTKREQREKLPENEPEAIGVGYYRFYPDSNKLVLDGKTISLTAKESNVLHIFALKPNEVIAREILQKEVWESKGVIVGRSLDVFISRLRKKLSEDPNLKITNLHGTGYKLIVNAQA